MTKSALAMNEEETKKFLTQATLALLGGVRVSTHDPCNAVMVAASVNDIVMNSYYQLEESIQKTINPSA